MSPHEGHNIVMPLRYIHVDVGTYARGNGHLVYIIHAGVVGHSGV